MNNKLTKYLIADKQIRLFVLKGEQIYRRVREFYFGEPETTLLTDALNISALINALNPDRPRMTFVFRDASRQNVIKTESFADGTITGTIELRNFKSFVNGTLQTITNANTPFGGAHQSYATLPSGQLYADTQHFYTQSEQTTTFFYPVNTSCSHDNMVILIQTLPFTSSQSIQDTCSTLQKFTSSTYSLSPINIERQLLTLLTDAILLEEITVTYTCHCSKDGLLDMILNLYGAPESNITQSSSQIEIRCPLCNQLYSYTSDDLLPPNNH